MAWGTASTSDSLTLSGSYATVQLSAADMIITLNPRERCQLHFKFDPQATPTEDLHVMIQASANNGTDYDTDRNPYAERIVSKAEDPAKATLVIEGIERFRIRAAVINTDGTAGGDDSGSTLVVVTRKDGVNA